MEQVEAAPQARGIDDAVKASAPDGTGTQERLAELVGVSQQAVSKWVAQGYVPTDRVVEVEQLTGVARARLINPALVDLLQTDL